MADQWIYMWGAMVGGRQVIVERHDEGDIRAVTAHKGAPVIAEQEVEEAGIAATLFILEGDRLVIQMTTPDEFVQDLVRCGFTQDEAELIASRADVIPCWVNA
jgi:hypothetical protein